VAANRHNDKYDVDQTELTMDDYLVHVNGEKINVWALEALVRVGGR
jgi:hypothetical protein